MFFLQNCGKINMVFKKSLCSVFCFIFLVMAVQAQAVVYHTENINQDTVWNASEVHVVDSTVNVNRNSTLILQPGSVVKFDSDVGLKVQNGSLQSKGTADNPIYFTSIRDDSVGGDTNGDGNASTPSMRDWKNIKFLSGSKGLFEHAVLSYGGKISGRRNRSSKAVINVNCCSNIKVKNSRIYENLGGIEINNFGGQENLNNCTNTNVVLSDNTIKRNSYGIVNSCSNVTIIENQVQQNSFGMIIFNASTEVSGNRIANNTEFGLGMNIEVAANSNITTQNTIENNGNHNSISLIGGTLNTHKNWEELNDSNLDMVVSGNLNIGKNGSLLFNPGSVIKFDKYGKLDVQGNLQVNGTKSSPVYFTSIKDDSVEDDINGNGNGTIPSAGDWGGVQFHSGSNGNLKYAVLRYGGDSTPVLKSNNSTIGLYNNKILQNEKGLRMIDSTVDVSGNKIANNTAYGLEIGIGITANFSQNTIEDNGHQNNIFLIGGTLNSHTTWKEFNKSNLDIVVKKDITIGKNGSLTLNSGSVVKFCNNAGLDVLGGNLEANGTSNNPIYFTSIKDDSVGGDTNKDGNATSPGKEDWRNIRFRSGGKGLFEHAVLRFGGDSWNPIIDVQCSSVKIIKSRVRFNSQGIRLSGSVEEEPIIQPMSFSSSAETTANKQENNMQVCSNSTFST